MDSRVRSVGSALVVAIAAGALFLFSPEWVLERLGWLAGDPVRFAVALVVLALVRPLLLWPATLVAVLAGYAWGLMAFPVALVLMVVTCTPPYLFGRFSADGGRFSEVGEKAMDVAGDFRGIVAGRVFPAPSDIVSVGSGLAGVRSRTYLGATAVGQIPWAFAGVAAGGSIYRVVNEGITAVVSPSILAATVVVAALMLAGPAYSYATDGGDIADVVAG
ncbi:TVP38/TMEM64 family protein [Halogeometricum limi]|uniref:Uncharacterized membrane protein YdjX, TVP38/TMEM64 family, SNARE-associated domain n=1 Tax=Halogeometricum limi TaxID=555875 RepID=A0A1I6HTI4_9EURY|nr:VTT domain-containing protein [Halogeometricum limi]SFR57772.1 Uncharacterized membrane protein YdjX, TVP38/TMEM64 family, SNARE-associated domain [Halogeometricum limi]